MSPRPSGQRGQDSRRQRLLCKHQRMWLSLFGQRGQDSRRQRQRRNFLLESLSEPKDPQPQKRKRSSTPKHTSLLLFGQRSQDSQKRKPTYKQQRMWMSMSEPQGQGSQKRKPTCKQQRKWMSPSGQKDPTHRARWRHCKQPNILRMQTALTSQDSQRQTQMSAPKRTSLWMSEPQGQEQRTPKRQS